METGMSPLAKKDAGMTISQVARAGGVHVETIRYYQRRGLLPEPQRLRGGIRRYDREMVRRTQFIRRAQALGFTLEETRALLGLDEMGSCAKTRGLAKQKLEVIESKIGELERMRSALAQLVASCESSRRKSPCPILHLLLEDSGSVSRIAPEA